MVSYPATTAFNSAPTIISGYATQIGANSVTMYVASSDDEYASGYWFYLNGCSVSPTSNGNGTSTSFLFGGGSLLNILLAFVIIDYVTGVAAAAKEGQLNSTVGVWGGSPKRYRSSSSLRCRIWAILR